MKSRLFLPSTSIFGERARVFRQKSSRFAIIHPFNFQAQPEETDSEYFRCTTISSDFPYNLLEHFAPPATIYPSPHYSSVLLGVPSVFYLDTVRATINRFYFYAFRFNFLTRLVTSRDRGIVFACICKQNTTRITLEASGLVKRVDPSNGRQKSQIDRFSIDETKGRYVNESFIDILYYKSFRINRK